MSPVPAKSQSCRLSAELADIDKYNAAIAGFNKPLETFNKNNDYLDKKRQQLLDRWNKAGPDFLGRHVPKNQ